MRGQQGHTVCFAWRKFCSMRREVSAPVRVHGEARRSAFPRLKLVLCVVGTLRTYATGLQVSISHPEPLSERNAGDGAVASPFPVFVPTVHCPAKNSPSLWGKLLRESRISSHSSWITSIYSVWQEMIHLKPGLRIPCTLEQKHTNIIKNLNLLCCKTQILYPQIIGAFAF